MTNIKVDKIRLVKKEKDIKEKPYSEMNEIEKFWWHENDECWQIRREGRVDYYFFTPTMKYLYKDISGIWSGTKNPFSLLPLGKEEAEKEFKKVKKIAE